MMNAVARRRRFLVVRVLGIAILATASAPRVMAWGADGHRIIAQIAWQRMTAEARAQVGKALGDQSLSAQEFADAATWADEIRLKRDDTTNWHFVLIPYEAARYDPERDCQPTARGDCSIREFDRAHKAFLDASLPPAQRGEALKFLIHIVGDLHQPLHNIDRGDRSGTASRVVFRGRTTNLHAAWDSALIQVEAMGWNGYADRLMGRMERSVKFDRATDAVEWAIEAHDLGREAYAYSGRRGEIAPSSQVPVELSPNYIARATAIIDQQLTRAGLRLASILNQMVR